MTKTEVLAYIASKIKTNGTGSITASVLADVLNSIVNMDSSSNDLIAIDDLMTVGDQMVNLTEAQVKELLSANRVKYEGKVYPNIIIPSSIISGFNNGAAQDLNMSTVLTTFGSITYDVSPTTLNGYSLYVLYETTDGDIRISELLM